MLDLILWKCGGPRYRTRGGELAAIAQFNVIAATGQRIWQGWIGSDWVEWDMDGRELTGNTSRDLTGERRHDRHLGRNTAGDRGVGNDAG